MKDASPWSHSLSEVVGKDWNWQVVYQCLVYARGNCAKSRPEMKWGVLEVVNEMLVCGRQPMEVGVTADGKPVSERVYLLGRPLCEQIVG